MRSWMLRSSLAGVWRSEAFNKFHGQQCIQFLRILIRHALGVTVLVRGCHNVPLRKKLTSGLQPTRQLGAHTLAASREGNRFIGLNG